MKVFISSVVSGFEKYREAAASAVETLGHTAIRAEHFGASPSSPRVACLQAVRAADVVMLIMGQRYGEVQSRGLSATHEEYREARDSKDVLVMIRNSVEFEPDQQRFLEEVQNWESGRYTKSFGSPVELNSAATRALHDLELSKARGSVDADEILDRAIDFLSEDQSGFSSKPKLAVSLASGPHQKVLRPSRLESRGLAADLLQIALFGQEPIFTTESGTQIAVEDDVLILEQEGRTICLAEDGTLDLTAELRTRSGSLPTVIEEDVTAEIGRFILFADAALSRIDDSHRLSHSVAAATLLDVGHQAWRTREEHQLNPNSISIPTIGFGRKTVEPVYLDPPEKPRSALSPSRQEIAEDLMVMLRRQFRD